ncbi:hypothetical protein KV697_03885 [Sphingomonas sanguinis]|uniref:Uncharacterized protein n=1 Tax=Sphingomonas sanguinis TaxID=33051 RepID=A0ABU5LNU5_9SPHN|nr:hypothetical protein [Sphingomonas sanguinis]MDZ7281609.1 hypothetical protein [Sphingomonas sanguinis]QXT36484.1 hypothetical protein KV697_03885 [Sphingomonas sanguinis]
MVDPVEPKKPRPPRRRATPKAAGAPAPRKRPTVKPEPVAEESTPAIEPVEGAETPAPTPPVKAKAPPKPRSTKRTSPRKAAPRKPAAIKPAPAPALGKHGLDRVGGKWGVASILGSLAAAAGLTAALLSLKGSSAKRDGEDDDKG